MGSSGGLDGKEFTCSVGDLGSIPELGRYPWRREQLPTPVFWPGEFHELYSPWGHKESDTTEWLSLWPSLVAKMVKHPPVMQETWVQSLGREDPLEKEMATHSIILAWRIPWMGEPGGLQSMGLQRVGHNWATNTHTPIADSPVRRISFAMVAVSTGLAEPGFAFYVTWLTGHHKGYLPSREHLTQMCI